MGDVSRVARQMREQERAAQARRRGVRTFDADIDGLSDAASPLFGGRSKSRGGPPPSPIQLPVGQCITVHTPSFAIPDGGGKVQFSQILETIRHGMGDPSLPLTGLKAPWSGVTQPRAWGEWLDVNHDSDWKGEDAYGQWLLNDFEVGPQFPARASALPVSQIVMPAMYLPVGRNDELSLWLSQHSGTTQNVRAWKSWGMQDPNAIRAQDPVSLDPVRIQARWWDVGASEPGSWHIDEAVAAPLGRVAVGTTWTNPWARRPRCDFIGAAVGGGTAPVPGEGGTVDDFGSNTPGDVPGGFTHWGGVSGLLRVSSTGAAGSTGGRMIDQPTETAGGEIITWDAVPEVTVLPVELAAATMTTGPLRPAPGIGLAGETQAVMLRVNVGLNRLQVVLVNRANLEVVQVLAEISQSFGHNVLYRMRLRITDA